MTTIVQLIPRWLRTRSRQPAAGEVRTSNKKVRQVLPTLPDEKQSPILWQDDNSPVGYRVLWKL